MVSLPDKNEESLNRALKSNGLRPTKQRTSVYEVILKKKDHPTADEVLLRVRKELPTISLATVYNCLETLVDCGLVRQVNFDRAPTRFCPNLTPHAHFKCTKTGEIFDLPMDPNTVDHLKNILPKGFTAENFDLSFVGSTNQSQ